MSSERGFGEKPSPFGPKPDPRPEPKLFSETHDRRAFSDDEFDDLGPDQNEIGDTFTATDAKNATGNYLLTIGYANSGKSTFHSMLFRYIEQSGKFNFEISGEKSSAAMLQRLSIWREAWMKRKSLLPTPRRESDIHRLTYKVTPTGGAKGVFEFSVLEVSGELLKTLDGTSGAVRIPSALSELLKNRNVKITLALIIDPESDRNNLLFGNLIDYLKINFRWRVDSLPIVAIIPKPAKALEFLKHYGSKTYEAYSELTGELKVDFAKSVAQSLVAHLRTLDSKDRLLHPLYIGELSEREKPSQDGKEEFLIEPDFKDIEKIFAWVYKRYVGREPGTSWVSDLKRMLD